MFVTLCVEVVRSLGFEFRFGFGFGFGFLRLGIRLLLAWVKVGSLSIWFKAVGLGGSKNQGTRPKALEKPGRGPGRGTKGYSVACGRGKAVGAFMKTKHTLSPRYTIRLYTPPPCSEAGKTWGTSGDNLKARNLRDRPVTLRKLTTPVPPRARKAKGP